MEVQRTDLENAAFSLFVVLVTRVILEYGLDFYVPLSFVDENMKRAQKRDAVLTEKFWWRVGGEVKEVGCNEIMNGGAGYEGLIPLIRKYVKERECGGDVERYLGVVEGRASGEMKTAARVIREIVTGHEEYKGDSRVTESMNYEIVKWYCNV